ncbi:MAG: DUF1810 domain-containing protein [Microcoleaceae cyanobacterium MO_207.B10]|nr:DUF1810 domain-containing protein [Microcoleaceae cyanobacterium MO_207.B10]
MIKVRKRTTHNDPFNLSRFISAQDKIYETVLRELKNAKKQSHWMWYIFPQIDGLAKSTTSKYYAIKSIEEAQQYLNHPVLGKRLLECAEIVFGIEGKSISEIFGYPDDLKFKSSMTMFFHVAKPDSIFARIIDKYFQGERDIQTLNILAMNER